jgi:cysteinyl-tRNA synthetase
VKNITDVGHMRQELLDRGEDKLIAQARREGKTSAQIAAFYTAAFLADEQALNIQPAHVFPKATDHIPEMLAIVRDLVAKEIAYQVDGTIFFDVTKFPSYGRLSGNQLAQSLEQLQGEQNTIKRHPEDFPLWKPAEPDREMAWDSQWGRGFPGWHIECSAMALKHLGSGIDIHTGGVDNIFPHHEDEIAQSEAHTGTTFARCWVHAQHLLCDGRKMAKSAGNAYTLADVQQRGFTPLALRYLFATAHYRTRTNFTFAALRAAETGLRRLRLLAQSLATHGEPVVDTGDAGMATAFRETFRRAIEDDLNMPRALAVVWALTRGASSNLGPTSRLALIQEFDQVLGLGLKDCVPGSDAAMPDGTPVVVQELARARWSARARGDFTIADALRSEIWEAGYLVRDATRSTMLVARPADEGLCVISRSGDVPDCLHVPAQYQFSVQLVSRNSRDDLERCLKSISRQRRGRSLEVVIVDNGSTDDTLPYLRTLAREGFYGDDGQALPCGVIFADHDLGHAAARNASMRAGSGEIVLLLDTSIELDGDIWTPLAAQLHDPGTGVVGPYALATSDLKEFEETTAAEADAVEGYLMAFRRDLWREVGPVEEKFRFYRLMDIYLSFMFKTSGYSVLRAPLVAERIIKHPHREWFSLGEEDRATKSKKNYDLFRRRWHHGESLLVANFVHENHWFGHDHPRHVDGSRAHVASELPPPGTPHTHEHRHWPDHSHTHAHVHESARG